VSEQIARLELLDTRLLENLLEELKALQRAFDDLLATGRLHLRGQDKAALDQDADDVDLVLEVRLLHHLFYLLRTYSAHYLFTSLILLF